MGKRLDTQQVELIGRAYLESRLVLAGFEGAPFHRGEAARLVEEEGSGRQR